MPRPKLHPRRRTEQDRIARLFGTDEAEFERLLLIAKQELETQISTRARR